MTLQNSKCYLKIMFKRKVFQMCIQLDLEWRDLICVTKDGEGPDKISKEPASCSLALRETGIDNDPNDKWRPAPGINSGCFDVRFFEIISFCQISNVPKKFKFHMQKI